MSFMGIINANDRNAAFLWAPEDFSSYQPLLRLCLANESEEIYLDFKVPVLLFAPVSTGIKSS